MPVVYRSKSFRRFDESNNRITDFLEKDNIKVLATAAAQLFISTPQLDKWFKSSTGTICFLKDFTRKCSYYFRLYSLMQGQLWEQEMRSPFTYQKASYLFHYLTVNRFNYGFKFICEDEAERFFSCITKFAVESTDSEIIESNLIRSINKPNVNKVKNVNNKVTSIKKTHRNLSADVCGSYLSTPSANASTNASVELKSECLQVKKHKSRRMAHSIDIKKRIEKSDISCPFRCSSNDLNVNQNNNNTSSLSKTDGCDSGSNQIDQGSIEDSNNSNKPLKYSIIKRALSSASTQSTSTKQEQVANKDTLTATPKLNRVISGSSSSINTLSIISSSPNINKSVTSTPKIKRKKIETSLMKQKLNLISESSIGENKEVRVTSEALELELIKNILMQYNVPINKRLIKVLKDYIYAYGSFDKFKKAIEQREEKNKLDAFVAASNAALIEKSNVLNTTPPLPTESPSKFNRFQAVYPSTHTPPSPIVSKLRQAYSHALQSAATTNIPITTPTTMIRLQTNTSVRTTNYQPLTPMSISRTNQSISTPFQSERTPVKTNPIITNSIQSYNLTRTQTPSPLRYQNQFFKQSIATTTPTSVSTATTITDSNAPPKPPRRSSLKTSN